MVDTAIFSKRLDALEDYLHYLTIDHGIAYRSIRDDLGDLDAFRRRALGKLNV